jgi:Na+/proline symporter
MEEEKYVSGEQFNVIKAKKSKSSNPRLNQGIILVIVAIIWSVAVFFLGVAYQKHHTKTPSIKNTSRAFPGGQFGGFGGNFANRTFGTVTAISASSITINNPRTNASSTLTINSSTIVTENGQATSLSTITVGETVSIELNSTDKTIASSIMIINLQNTNNGSSTDGSQLQSQ